MTGPTIAYVTDQSLPNTVATSDQVLNMAAALGAAGARLDLLIPYPRPFPAPATLQKDLAAYYGVAPAFDVVCLPSSPLGSRVIHKAQHAVLATRYARQRPYDVVYTRTVLAALLALARGLRVVLETYHVLDAHRPRTARLVSWLTRCSDRIGVITHSSLARDSLLRAGAAAGRVAVFHNGFNPRRTTPALGVAEARQRLGWDPAEQVVCYTGRVDVDKGALAILDLAARTPEIIYVAVGDTERTPRDWLVRKARAGGCHNVRWCPAVPPSELNPYVYAADVLLIPPTAAPLETHGRTVLPLKTYMYMAAGRPILAPTLPDITEVLTTDCAVLTPPDDPDAAAQALRQLFAHPAHAAALGAAARDAAVDLTWERRAQRILSWLATAPAG